MAKVKVKRSSGAEGAVPEVIEVEESEVLETDEKIPEQQPGKKEPEKSLPQSEVNKLMADQRRKHEQELKTLRDDYDAFKKSIEDKEKAANDAAEAKVAELRKDLPESIGKLLDKLTPVEQLDWLNDPANVIAKKEIPPLPPPREEHGKSRQTQTII